MTKEVNLSTGETVLVDDEDFPVVSRYSWRKVAQKGYAGTTMKSAEGVEFTMYMHHLILATTAKTDHANTNHLDNRKDNLRPATHSQNGANARKMQMRAGMPLSSKYKGVFFDKGLQMFRAQIVKDRRRYGLGSYTSEDDAGRAYNEKAVELFGKYALLNEIN